MIERFDPRGLFKPREKKEGSEEGQRLYLPNFDVLVVSGFAGTGKTSASDDLNQIIIGTEFVKIGQNVRAETDDLINIDPQKDTYIDLGQERLMLKTLNSSPLILESRFGAVIGADIVTRFKEKSPRIVKILTTADEKTRHQRLVKRGQNENPNLSADEIIDEEVKRDLEFVRRMQHLYPFILMGQHPFDPNIKDVNGKPVYDIVIDTTNIAKGKVKDAIVKALGEKGYLSRLKRASFGEGESGDRAYDLIRTGSSCEYDNCQKLAKQTLDSSSSRTIHSFPVCSEEHSADKKIEISEWAKDNKIDVRFGRNGKFEEDGNPSQETKI